MKATLPVLLLVFCSCRTERDWLRSSERAIDLYDQGLYEESLAPARDSLDAALKLFGEEDIRTVYSIDHLGKIYLRRGDFPMARALFERSLRINETLLEPDNPKHAYYLSNLAELHMRSGRCDLAEPLLDRSLELYRAYYGEISAPVAKALVRLGGLYRRWGLHRRAEPLVRRAEAIGERLGEFPEDLRAEVDAELCETSLSSGDLEAAARRCRRALELREGLLPSDHPDLAASLGALGRLELLLGRPAEAQSLLRKGLGVLARRPGSDDFVLRELRLAQAELDSAEGRCRRAEEALRGVLPEVEDSYAAVKAQVRAARVYARAGRHDAAELLYRSAMARLEESPGADESDREAVLVGLAESELALGRTAPARRLLEEALAGSDAFRGPAHAGLAEALLVLSRALVATGSRREGLALAERADAFIRLQFLPRHPLQALSRRQLCEIRAVVGS